MEGVRVGFAVGGCWAGAVTDSRHAERAASQCGLLP